MWLRHLSKLTCTATLFLIFVGGMVTSTGSGLAVPDWPLSYGMIFPPMVGGVFYEHSHRLVAASVGFLMLILLISLFLQERRTWVKNLGLFTFGLIILQGILGGLTVINFLPPPLSITHGILAQTFFIATIVIAYSVSGERQQKVQEKCFPCYASFSRLNLFLIALIYIQLIIGAMMRHTGAGLAIPDFPKMGGYWLPPFNDQMLHQINLWRIENNLDPISMPQVVTHFLHRSGAFILAVITCLFNIMGIKYYRKKQSILKTLLLLDVLVISQIILGIMTVLSLKSPQITSWHVVNGAAILGVCVLLFLRSSPLSFHEFKRQMLT